MQLPTALTGVGFIAIIAYPSTINPIKSDKRKDKSKVGTFYLLAFAFFPCTYVGTVYSTAYDG